MQISKKQDIILEIGSEYIRVGLVADRVPRKMIKSGQCFNHQNRSDESYQMVMEQLLYKIFFAYINCPCQGKTVILLQKVHTDRKTLEVIAKILFNKLKVDKIEFALSCVTPIYLSARYFGLVVSAGASTVEIMPVFQSFPIIQAFQCLPVGTNLINKLIREILTQLNPQVSQQVFKGMSQDDITEIKNSYSSVTPSQQITTVSQRRNKYKFQPSRIHFRMFFGDIDKEQHNIAYSFLKACNMVPIKCLDEIAKNVIFAGGIWRIKGMQKLFKMHVQNEMYRFPKLQRLHLVDKLSFVSWSFNPTDVSWIGCSIGASIRSIDHLSLKKPDYNDNCFIDKIMQAYFNSA